MCRVGTLGMFIPVSACAKPSARDRNFNEIQRRDGNEIVAEKVNLRSFSLYREYSYPFTLSSLYKKCDARAKLLFCLLNQFFATFSLPSLR